MRAKSLLTPVLLLCALSGASAQGVVTPPVSTFRPDTSLPSVKVPEFVITGKAQIELPKAYKPTIEIDSSYFQGKDLRGVTVDVPSNRSLSSRAGPNTGNSTRLFARASLGHYSTARYLLSGGTRVGGFDIDAGFSGDYTNGFAANTMQRDFSLHAGISKELNSEEFIKSSNLMDLDYSRSSYSLYGGPLPVLQRSTENFSFGVSSDMYLNELPFAFGLEFGRSSLDDYWHNTESSLRARASTQVQLPDGWLGLDGALVAGSHSVGYLPSGAPAVSETTVLDRSLYNLHVGGSYGNTLFDGALSFSAGLVYYQYRDDTSNTVAKLYPDVRADYLVADRVSIFASFHGAVRDADIPGFVSTDRFVDGSFRLVSAQYDADASFGTRIAFSGGFVLTPAVRYKKAKFYPVFSTTPINTSFVTYAGSASVTTVSVTGQYSVGALTSELVLEYQKGKADSLSSIPNLPPFDANLRLVYNFTREFAGSAQFLYLSSRYSDAGLSRKLDPVGLMNVRFSYDFSIARLPIEIFAGGDNILNQKYFVWQGYQEFPLTLYVGLSSRIL